MKYIMIGLLMFSMSIQAQNKQETETIVLGAGCFWCIEAIFDELKGVELVESGYMGGEIKNPSYKQVVSGFTGHAEVVQLTFNPKLISLSEILEVFWSVHDPTTLNRQGSDVGTQYRSVIFYETEAQRKLAMSLKSALSIAQVWDKEIVTEITKSSTFYLAEAYHQDYYALNANKNPNCSFVITPKLEKFRKVFQDKLK